ncbi:type VI secretion system membrane subunit TssM [Agarivorans litoreus]|uniref:type VI secretion system membrane subunit TssM n=1 Tax=Agarivorans litoreus TaxID=1510455 RepID=UPI001C7D941A|nr:type VI secretion system membrane subunit TssM [Agarivorans litoreus]
MFNSLFFQRLVQMLKSKWAITLLGFLALAFLIWFGGPLIAIAGAEPLGSASARLFTIITLALICIIYQFWQHVRSTKQNQEAVQSLLDGQDEHGDDEESRREVETLRERVVTALDVLKNSSLAKGQGVYQLPWYIMIGPPGTGKTTALQNSGLEFPLKDKLGDDPLAGVGGTRHCDWWFTNKAVLIDTAGRYTTQDSNSAKDSRAWLGFLGLLKKYRTKRPINGAIVTVSLASLIQQTRTERNLHARAIKQRIQELKNQLGMQFPVYVVLTKADLIAGFSEFFADLNANEREQIWGITFPLTAENADTGVVGLFNREFHGLLKRIQTRLNVRLQQERDIDKRTLMYEFPKQMHLLQSSIDDFLKEIFSPNAFEEAPMLRGLYIASATQEGKPIDRVMAETSNGLGLGQVPLKQQGGETKGYFIKRLLEDVIFPEKFVGSVNRHHQKHSMWTRRIVAGGCVLSLLTCSLLWYNSYSWNKQLVDTSEAAVDQYKAIVKPGLSTDTDVITLVQALNALRDLPAGFSQQLVDKDVHRMGLYQGEKIGQPAKMAYQRALQGFFATYLTESLTHELVENEEYLEYLYETLKTYLMIYDAEHREIDQIYSWFEIFYERRLPGEINQGLRQDLMVHTRNLFAEGINLIPVNDKAIAQARSVLTRMPLAERAYQRLRIEFLSSHVADFRLSDVFGRQGRQVFVRNSGAPLHEGIPGLYTYSGFHGLFRIENNRIVKRLMEDSWVYGDSLSIDEATRDEVVKAVSERYFRDYVFEWEQLLADVQLRPYASAKDGAVLAKNLTGSERPLQSFILAVQKELRLTEVTMSDNTKMAGEVAGNVADVALKNQKARINRFLPNDMSKAKLALPGAEVEAEFEDFLNISEADLEGMHVSLLQLRDYLEVLSESNNKRAYTSLMDDNSQAAVTSALRRSRKDLPAPFSTMLGELSSQTSSLAKRGAQVHVNAIWKDSVYKEYRAAIRGKYPFDSKAAEEVRLKDFGRFFGYGGTMDTFFERYLKSSVDTSKRNWKLERSVGIDPGSLKVFQQARRIRDVFFEPGSQTPRVEFGLKPLYLDGHINNFRVELGEQELVYRHGPQRTSHFIWPTDSSRSTRLAFVPPKSGHSISETYPGHWGLFRMLDGLAKQRPDSRKDNVLDIEFKGNKVQLELIPTTAMHPFWSKDLARFSCPVTL